MKNYSDALENAETVLKANGTLIDYHAIDDTQPYPFAQFNDEVLFHSTMIYKGVLSSSKLRIDSLLYQSYSDQDLRKRTFFWNNNGILTFKGSYDGFLRFFSGLTTSELYLIKAECLERLGRSEEALLTLNHLRSYRYADNSKVFPAYSDLLKEILAERRRELIFRGLRWSDLRRLNSEERFRKTITRDFGNEKYVLLPNSNRYVLPIPDIVISLDGISQNPRD